VHYIELLLISPGVDFRAEAAEDAEDAGVVEIDDDIVKAPKFRASFGKVLKRLIEAAVSGGARHAGLGQGKRKGYRQGVLAALRAGRTGVNGIRRQLAAGQGGIGKRALGVEKHNQATGNKKAGLGFIFFSGLDGSTSQKPDDEKPNAALHGWPILPVATVQARV
jgi:hypothetical protein